MKNQNILVARFSTPGEIKDIMVSVENPGDADRDDRADWCKETI